MTESTVEKEPHIVVAHTADMVIGINNELPWGRSLPQDLKNFKNLTMGGVVLMGRKTHESIGRPLPGRENRVLTKDTNYEAVGCRIFTDPIKALEDSYDDSREIFIIGGEQIYELYLPMARFITATLVDATIEGDTFFPEIDEDEWTVINEMHHEADDRNKYDFTVKTMRKKPKYIDVLKARTAEQFEHYKSIERAGVCPFCPEHIDDYHQGEIVQRSSHWTVARNMKPYSNTSEHLVLIPNEHINNPADLNEEAWSELSVVIQRHSSGLNYGGVAWRFGELENTGASVAHAHVHLIQPDQSVSSDESKKVKFKISR